MKSIWIVALAVIACDGSETGAPASSAATTGGGGNAGSGSGAAGQMLPPAAEDWTRDIRTTALELDVGTLAGRATIVLAASGSQAASFETGDLQITSVTDGGIALDFEVAQSQLDVGVPETDSDATLLIDYTFAAHTDFDGWMPVEGVSLLWPEFCGNLFPCKSAPSEGVSFTMNVTGYDPSATAVYPAIIPADAPSYMPALAVADFTKVVLGTTTAGTTVNVWYSPGGAADATAGTINLVDVFDFYEQTYGAYSFGSDVGSVSAAWGGGAYGGMEHHPYWHVSSIAMDSEIIHAHEAAHGWFGNGVRIACWEDFVLSEGTVTYLAARALGALAIDVWPTYECALKDACLNDNTIALPDATCDSITILTDPLWGSAPYYKGAYFYREVAMAIGEANLDSALAEFYVAHVGGAARMQELIDHIKTKTDATGAATVDNLTNAWLKTLACPVNPSTLCP